MDSACEMLTVWLGKFGLFIQETEYARPSGLYQIDAVLVVHKAHALHAEPFLLVELLLVLQDPLVEELLEFLVAVVDAELLETVLPKNFEAVDVKNSNYRGIGDVRLKWRISTKTKDLI